MNSSFLIRIRILIGLFLVLAVLVLTKLVFVQIVDRDMYRERADRQYATPAQDMFERGNIYFKSRDGSLIGAATTVTGFKISINPKEIEDSEKMLADINSVIKIDEEAFRSKVTKKDDPYEEVANRLSREVADKIKALNRKDIGVYREKWRFYPGGELAAHSLGYLGYEGDNYSGRGGLERYYNGNLARKNDELYVNFFAEIFAGISASIFPDQETEADIITTIEPTTQAFLEKALLDIKKKWQSDAVGGVVIDPKIGAIAALAHLPAYDPNKVKQIQDISLLNNPLVQNVYEFGSVVKPLTMVAGLDAGAVTKDTMYDDRGFVTLNNKKINNFDFKARGFVNMQEVLNQSLNTGAVFVMQEIGAEKYKNYMLSFGLGEKTGIDLPAETSGLIDNLKSNIKVDYATTAFGQGIAFTPMEAVRAFSTLANGGFLITPHLVKEIRYTSSLPKKIKYSTGRQIISPESSEEITRMLVEVVDTALLSGSVKMDRYSIAAKTGTAQISKGQGGGYYDDRYLHSFFGYFPAHDPKFLIFLYNVYPKGAKYASHTLTEPFMDLAKFLINYYNIPPDR